MEEKAAPAHTDLTLSHCPFCGHHRIYMLKEARYDLEAHPEWETDSDAYAYYATCGGCAAQGPWRKHPNNAARAWNMRVDPKDAELPKRRSGRPPKAKPTLGVVLGTREERFSR